ncbi:MAG: LysE family transporter [Dethiobacteria bacterium]|jgi:threonine/homoserine/homoserine lactone efflux protein|nr:LysE family transporter [Bacillota bacterium]
MELTTIFVTAFVVGLSGAMMPGPLTAVLAENSLRRGFIAGPLVTLGHGIVEALMVALLAVGLGQIIAEEAAAGVIGIAGGLMLVWMGYGMVKSALSGSLSLTTGSGEQRRQTPLIGGMITTVSNPYWFLWWATVGASYVLLSKEHGIQGVFLFFSGHILSDFAWLSLLALALVSGKRFLNDKIYAGIIAVLGLFLVSLGIYFFWSGINFLT